tara:strand:+ start:46689 stop:48023 length:1335 start_codon:yes stop_codon:yes gene_type:complete
MNDFTPDELNRLIKTSGESDNIDFKGPMTWDKSTQSAKLAKVIVSFANSRDGGAIVVGRSEVNGQFETTGLTDEEAISFETTKVSSWINSRFSPPVRLVCNPVEYECKRIVVITISQFEDIPIICTKPLLDPKDSRKELLKLGTIYIRNQNAESAPLKTVEELRTLIGLSTSRQGDQILSMFDSLLKGKSLLPSITDEEQFEKELAQIKSGMENVLKERMSAGGWRLRVYPASYIPERWNDNEELESIIQKRSVRIRDEFPPSRYKTHPREWGICNDYYSKIWTLSRSGLFAFWQSYSENKEIFKSPWIPLDAPHEARLIGEGKWLDFTSNIYIVAELFMFLSRLVEEYESGEEVTISLNADSLAGRILESRNPRVSVNHGNPEPCRANSFEFTKRITVEEFRAEWENICADALKRFFEYFPDVNIRNDILLKWVNRFKNREFD